MPEKEQYKLVNKGKGTVLQHVLANEKAEDYAIVKRVAIERAELGKNIIINPELHIRDPLREVVFPDAFDGKNPDLREDGILIEIETPQLPLKRRALANRITKGSKQATVVLLNLEDDFGQEQLLEIIEGRFKSIPQLIKVIVRTKGEYKDYIRGLNGCSQ